MSRSGYSDDGDWADYNNALALYRNAVDRSIRGRRGQAMLRALGDALDAMPFKRLVAHDLIAANGEVCALGCLGVARGIELPGPRDWDPEDWGKLAKLFNVAPCLVREVMFENDDGFCGTLTPEARWTHMREWVAEQLTPPPKEPR